MQRNHYVYFSIKFILKHALIVLLLNFSVACISAQDLALWKKEMLEAANTGATATYLTDEEKKVLLLVNLARIDGKAFITNVLDPFVKETNPEDNDYLKSLYTDLRDLPALSAMAPLDKLCQSAGFHANDMGVKGTTGHNSSDGTKCFDRIHKYHHGGFMAENCSYGYSDALNIVMQLLIDDGIASKGHRTNILSPNYKRIGISIKPHKGYRYNCVMDFSD